MSKTSIALAGMTIALCSSSVLACDECSRWPPPRITLPGQVSIESACYTKGPITQPSTLFLTYYTDKVENRIIGGFIRKNGDKTEIPLLFVEATMLDDYPELDNYEITWLEIIDKRITGSYKVIQEGAGIRQGRYILYKKLNSKKDQMFTITSRKEICG